MLWYKTVQVFNMLPWLGRRRGFCFCGESITAGIDKKKKKEDMRIVDFLNEGDDEMTKKKGGSSSLPSSPRLLLSRWIASLAPRCGLSSGVQKGKSVELRRIEGDGSKAVLGSLARVAPDDGGLQLELAGDGHGQLEFEKIECVGSRMSNGGENLEFRNQSPSVSINGEEDGFSKALGEVSHSKEPGLGDPKDRENPSTSTCSASMESVVSTGRHIEETSFGLGIGAGLVFLFAKSKYEFNKMMELHTRIEMLLKDITDEMQRKDVVSNSSETNTIVVYSASDSHGIERQNKHIAIQNHGSSLCLPQSHSAIQYDQPPKFSSASESEKYVGMAQLEAELEAELERLQLNLDAEKLSAIVQQEDIEVVSETAAPLRSFTERYEEHHDTEESSVCYGVSPTELEQKLHEVLETRQQERIEELEISLESAKQKLHEKEMEIQWWKDNVQFLLQQKKGSSGMRSG